MPRKLLGIHLICRDGLNVQELGRGRFKSGYWSRISEQSASSAEYLALHNQKNLPSYKQGIIESYERLNDDENRIIFYVKATPEPREWVGLGTGEKGYSWSED
ncbi:hypothetical protein NG799_10775 [Laspinema sp. D1]|uniref:Uncharacterized protein n=1 Tax=Laspinema palackyanum D2a TaxID=2953684 RepID=A0ABT2MTQ2_9CYAN|nr:hypothetical protein [Laspinema sp. D2a]